MGHAILERVLLFGTRSADYIRASGHSGCIATEVILQATTGRIHDRCVYREPHPVCRRSNPAILVVKAAENGSRGNATDALDRSMEPSVFAE